MRDERKTVVEARGLNRNFQSGEERLIVLDDLDLDLRRGEAVAIMGQSGSGKSTLLHILGTLDRPTSGSVRIEEADPFSLSPGDLAIFRNERLGFVFQDHHLLPQCTVLENVLIPTLVSRRRGEAKRDRARQLLDRVGIGARADHLPAEISGGERQRAAIARALINDPALLLCDEPTGNLDRKTSDAITELFAELRRETDVSVIAVTHSAEFAEAFDRTLLLRDGKLEPATPVGATA